MSVVGYVDPVVWSSRNGSFVHVRGRVATSVHGNGAACLARSSSNPEIYPAGGERVES